MTPIRRDRGFTLIELMVTVAIIAILAGIAYPSYRSYVMKGHRASAQAFLLDGAQRQAQYFLDNRTFAPDLTTLFGVASPIPSEVAPYYTVTIETGAVTATTPLPTFILKAEPKGTQATGSEPTLSIDQAGTKTPAGTW